MHLKLSSQKHPAADTSLSNFSVPTSISIFPLTLSLIPAPSFQLRWVVSSKPEYILIGKSASDDMICNEILKSLSEANLMLLCKVFNQCLSSCTYPWNNSIISPLHKKGCKTDPDNYRAVAVSSTIGKLFSTVILNRLIKYKDDEKPDPVNQLGFAKGAQTYDHILTLNTITSKYKNLKNQSMQSSLISERLSILFVGRLFFLKWQNWA